MRISDWSSDVCSSDLSFSDEAQRQKWYDEKGMKVLNFHSDAYRSAGVDVFVYEPFDFAREHEQALRGELLPGIVPRFVSIPALIAMKLAAGRPRDLDDIAPPRLLQKESGRAHVGTPVTHTQLAGGLL